MSPQFSQGKAAIKKPAICIKPSKNLPAAYVLDQPTELRSAAWWYDSGIPIAIAESFQLVTDAGVPGWTGASAQTGWNLQLTIKILPAQDLYDFLLNLRDGPAIIDDDSWHNIHVPPGPPWKSGILQHLYALPTDRNGIQVLD